MSPDYWAYIYISHVASDPAGGSAAVCKVKTCSSSGKWISRSFQEINVNIINALTLLSAYRGINAAGNSWQDQQLPAWSICVSVLCRV